MHPDRVEFHINRKFRRKGKSGNRMSTIIFWVLGAVVLVFGGYSNYTNWKTYFASKREKEIFMKNHHDAKVAIVGKTASGYAGLEPLSVLDWPVLWRWRLRRIWMLHSAIPCRWSTSHCAFIWSLWPLKPLRFLESAILRKDLCMQIHTDVISRSMASKLEDGF